MNDKTVSKISNIEILNDAIIFLKKGFNFSNKSANKIKYSLLKENNCIGFFGYVFKDRDDTIIGAILTHYQGTIIDKKIINLSSWYVMPKYRGIHSIYMARIIKKDLKGFIITNFSPNESALKIFESIGFKRLKTFTSNFFLPNYLVKKPSLFFKRIHIIKINSNILNKKTFLKLPNNILIKDTQIIKIEINEEFCHLMINKSRIEKSWALIRFSSPRLNILWTSNYSFFRKYINLIISKLMIKYFSPIVSTHFLKLEKNSPNLVWRYHLQYSDNGEIEAPVIGSEYSIRL